MSKISFEEARAELLQLGSKYGVTNIRVFGSRARGTARPGSDVDLLVAMEAGRTLLDLVGFWQDAEELLGCKVDVVSEGGLSPYLKDRVYAEARPL